MRRGPGATGRTAHEGQFPSNGSYRSWAGLAALCLGCSTALAGGATDEGVESLFREFRERVADGDLASARRGVEAAAADRGLGVHSETFRSLAAVARSLAERRAAVRTALEALVDREVELKTSRGVRKGTVTSVTDEGIEVRMKITMRGKVLGETRVRVKWSELTADEEAGRAKGWEPKGNEGAIARALVALSHGDGKGAARRLRPAGTHPFAVWLLGELGPASPPAGRAGEGKGDGKDEAAPAPGTLGKGGLYGYRTGEDRLEAALRFGGSKASEAAVEKALKWLARAQEPDGRWSIERWGGNTDEEGCVGLTGLSLLAFLSAGHTEKAGAHRRTVLKAVAYLIGRQGKDGAIGINRGSASGGGYNHAMAGLALAESFGMARVPRTGIAAQKAVAYAVDIHMCDTGGWRYSPRSSPCTSVTGWFFMFLSSARKAGIKVDPKGFLGAKAWFDKVTTMPGRGAAGEVGRAGYQPGRSPTPSMTAIVVLARRRMGLKRTSPLLTGGADYLMEDLPQWGRIMRGSSHVYYCWYYGTHAMFQMGGDWWKKWNAATRDMLVRHQVASGDPAEDGSWEPVFDGRRAGRVYSTAMACLCLEVYYRYKRQW